MVVNYEENRIVSLPFITCWDPSNYVYLTRRFVEVTDRDDQAPNASALSELSWDGDLLNRTLVAQVPSDR